MRSLRRLGVGFVVPVVVLASCQDPTQITASLQTNVKYESGKTAFALWTSTSGAVAPGAQPEVTYAETWTENVPIGEVVITPPGEKSAPLLVRAVLGVGGKPPADCANTVQKGCIVATRKLAFVPHTRLRVPIVLHLACEGVACGADETCNYLGRCVSASVNPDDCARPEGCALPGDDKPSTDAGASDTGVDVGDVGVTDAADAADAPDARDARDAADAADAALPEVVQLASSVGNAAVLVPPDSVEHGHTCARFRSGALKCWGDNFYGQLGLGDTRNRGTAPSDMGSSLPAVALGPGRTATYVAVGTQFTCVILDDGSVKCWGRGEHGRLGTGDQDNHLVPAPVDLGASKAKGLAAGEEHACALLTDGGVKCWGYNRLGQLGLGVAGLTISDRFAPTDAVDLGPGRTARKIAAGFRHTCALLDDGTVKCWGDQLAGQLGLNEAPIFTPHGTHPATLHLDGPPAAGLDFSVAPGGAGLTVVDLGAGGGRTWALLSDGRLFNWGEGVYYNALGLGDGANRGDDPGEMSALEPVDVGAGKIAQVSAGQYHTCVRFEDGRLKCWGDQRYGQLGTGDGLGRGAAGTMGDLLAPINLGGLKVVEVSLGGYFTCARLDSGAVKCWGTNALGELGLGDTISRGRSPTDMGSALPSVRLY